MEIRDTRVLILGGSGLVDLAIGRRSVAFEMLGPPRLGKLLYGAGSRRIRPGAAARLGDEARGLRRAREALTTTCTTTWQTT